MGGRPAKPDIAAQVAAHQRSAAQRRTTPVVAHCPTCDHEWAVAFLPMELEQAAALMKAARCPKGCTAGPRVGSIA